MLCYVMIYEHNFKRKFYTDHSWISLIKYVKQQFRRVLLLHTDYLTSEASKKSENRFEFVGNST